MCHGLDLSLKPKSLDPEFLKLLNPVQVCHGLDVSPRDNTILAGDNLGRINLIDPRQDRPYASPTVHKKDKVSYATCMVCRASGAQSFEGLQTLIPASKWKRAHVQSFVCNESVDSALHWTATWSSAQMVSQPPGYSGLRVSGVVAPHRWCLCT